MDNESSIAGSQAGVSFEFVKREEAVNHQRFFEALMINSPVAIIIQDLQGRIVSCNPAFENMFGYIQSEVAGQLLDPLITTSVNYLEASNYSHRVIQHGEKVRAPGTRHKKDGSPIQVDIQGVPIVVGGENVGILTLYHDITERNRAEEALRDFYSSFVYIMDGIDADIYVSSLDTYRILFVNRHMQSSFGSELVGKICHQAFRNEPQPCAHCSNAKLMDVSNNPSGEYIWEGRNPLTGRRYKNSDRAIKWGDGRYVRLQIATDITELKEAENRLRHMATHDPLTGLPNRILFQEKLALSISAAERTGAWLAILFIDLDKFKDVNDKFGHSVGDLVLKEAARRMHECLRDGDVIARVSGDEFTIILEDVEKPLIPSRVADRILHCVSAPYMIEGNTIEISASIGISLYHHFDPDADRLLRHADEAMYQVKKLGGNAYRFYAPLE